MTSIILNIFSKGKYEFFKWITDVYTSFSMMLCGTGRRLYLRIITGSTTECSRRLHHSACTSEHTGLPGSSLIPYALFLLGFKSHNYLTQTLLILPVKAQTSTITSSNMLGPPRAHWHFFINTCFK